jgi:ADP-dependent NAD(P)H-hydrate dehydratase / NAD(P)H-hydrate epimerase
MQLLVTADQMRSFDRETIERLRVPGLLLMENAGRECVRALEHTAGLRDKRVLVVCGRGNNGGDGFVVARHLTGLAQAVDVVLLGSPSGLKGDAGTNFHALQAFAGRSPEVLTIRVVRSAVGLRSVPTPDVIVDAILGTGFAGEVKGLPASAIEWINRKKCFVLAVDIPSGVDASTGKAGGPAVRADLTVTMAAAKIGHFVGEGCDLSGRVEVRDIGIPDFVMKPSRSSVLRPQAEDARTLLPARKRAAHKYSAGKVLVIAGSRSFTGAPALAAESALRTGSGAVILGVPVSAHRIVARKLAEVIVQPLEETAAGTVGRASLDWIRDRLGWADALAIGPGMGRDDETDALIVETVLLAPCPVVLDADGLTAFAPRTHLLRKRKHPTIATPHAGELGRMLGIPSSTIEGDRIEYARIAAKRFACTVVLKGAPTVTADPRGRVVVNATGNPGMATIGSGDVLTGIIAGLIAQGAAPSEAGWAGAYLHGLAGDLARDRYGIHGMLASDILSNIPGALMAVHIQ